MKADVTYTTKHNFDRETVRNSEHVSLQSVEHADLNGGSEQD